ncbi:putative adenylate kinase 1, chloroplastic [Apostasia shenzhenica]|uniref:adenylate kinase n=1 Tax=Apostasia shenzhenica TaxID=1088818 RepID=A0A2I0AYK5_9ASPA|nr:putative adenylate kinase 1, chloroplastic [Apostasia shenzhenica]
MADKLSSSRSRTSGQRDRLGKMAAKLFFLVRLRNSGSYSNWMPWLHQWKARVGKFPDPPSWPPVTARSDVPADPTRNASLRRFPSLPLFRKRIEYPNSSSNCLAASSMAALRRLLRLATEAATRRSPAARGISCSALKDDLPISVSWAQAAAAQGAKRDAAARAVQWVFLGCPGVGKGTYASRLSQLLHVPHISTGDLVRDELSSSGSFARQVIVPSLNHHPFHLFSLQLADIVNQGRLVPDEVIINLLSKRLQSGAAKGESGFILDGFPRTIRQAEILEGVTNIDLVVNLKLREDMLLEKCLGRRICGQCGGNFNIAAIDIKGENGAPGIFMPPLLPPPQCASKLITRLDDTVEVVKKRLRVYSEMSQPVEEFYLSRGKLLEFDLPGGIPETWPKLLHALNLDDHDEMQTATA